MSDIFSSLLELDKQIFHTINYGLANPAFDLIFPNITDLHKIAVVKWLLIPALLALIIWSKKKGGLVIVFGLAIALGIADFIGGKLIKPFFARPRPDMAGLDVVLRSPHYNGFSFTSNHASNIFCAMVFLAFFFPKAKWPLLIFAFLVSFSRVYAGVHYPSDVFFGGLWGALLGYGMAKLTSRLKWLKF